jgi:hypothetical protein
MKKANEIDKIALRNSNLGIISREGNLIGTKYQI